MVKAALIDMDGTLYDSMGAHAKAWARLMTEAGVPFAPDEFYRCEGMTGRDTINKLYTRHYGHGVSPEQATEMYRRKTEYFHQYGPVGPMAGAQRLLQLFKQAGVQCILVTGSGQASLIERLERDFPGTFAPERMVTGLTVTHGKPHPEPYLTALKIAGVEPHEAIAIENAPLGVLSAHRAGVFTVAVNTGPLTMDELAEAGADVVFPSMPMMAQAVERLLAHSTL